MINKIILLASCLIYAYVLSKPSTPETDHEKILHRAKRWEELPNVTFSFDCDNRAVGFYADIEHHCQIFHMCDEDGRRIPYICANDTSFNQKYRICDWEYNFDCANSHDWYFLNELTYVTDTPEEKAYRG